MHLAGAHAEGLVRVRVSVWLRVRVGLRGRGGVYPNPYLNPNPNPKQGDLSGEPPRLEEGEEGEQGSGEEPLPSETARACATPAAPSKVVGVRVRVRV